MSNENENPLKPTENAIAFMLQLENNESLAEQCEKTDLEGRIAIARQMNLQTSEAELRRAITMWDYAGDWHKWLSFGRIDAGTDDLPDLDPTFQVTEENIKSFRENGFLVLRNVASKTEIEKYRPVIRNCLESYNTQYSFEKEKGAFLQTKNLRMRNQAAKKFTTAARFGKIAADLLEVDSVRIYHDQALFKESGGTKTAWHQDSLYYPLDTNKVITIWIPLVNVKREMGTMHFAKGSHKKGYLGFNPIGEEAEGYFSELIKKQSFEIFESPDLEMGDASLHHGWVLHGTPPNSTEYNREAIVIAYYPDGTRLLNPLNVYQERVIKYMYRGLKPGDPANGSTNHVAYSAEK
ncbi:MAG: phytanoyl-CoA dioxygenase family protein [SAR324 cluster bacterium]|nr:phytanoyl-CoA dioxygenase family protein [SAR324 cluster bacterium]